jgi:hypothetical protein
MKAARVIRRTRAIALAGAAPALLVAALLALVLTGCGGGSGAATASWSHGAPSSSVVAVNPRLILTNPGIEAIRARLDAGLQPESAAWNVFVAGRLKSALSGAPTVFAGPLTGGGVGSPLELALDKDGAAARDLALAYAFVGDDTYASTSREYLLAWAKENTPTTFADCEDKWAGSYQAHGAFMFAYAYDLIRDSGVLSPRDRAAVEGWFRRFVDALDTYNVQLESEWVITHPTFELPYAWDAARRYNVYDNYVGGDMVLLQQTARRALARAAGYSDAVDAILNDSSSLVSLESISRAPLMPRNEGDGVTGHAVPAPQVDVYKAPIPGRGGTIDYMTYNTRIANALLELAQNAGWDRSKTSVLRERLKGSWDYLAQFFGPGAEPVFVPGDVINADADLPRFALAYRDFGDARYLSILGSGDRSGYYEPQLLGPVTLTHSIPSVP